MIYNLFIPGFGLDREICKTFINSIEGIRYIPNPGYTYKALCSSLDTYASAGAKLNLAGWSLGALFALRWAAEHPGSINALFLTGATARFCSRPGYDNGIKEKTLRLMLKQLPENPRLVMRNFYNSALEGIAEKEMHISRHLANLDPAANLQNGLQELLQTDLLDTLSAITVPVCIYQGAKDSITPLKGAQILQSRLPAAEIIVEPEGGHCLPVSHPEKTAACYAKVFRTPGLCRDIKKFIN